MALIDAARKLLTLKIVYYGCARGGKTTNLASLHKLSDPAGDHRLVSIATDDDRTLFFDLLPMELGQVGGMTVQAKVYTVPGQVHYELTRRRVLAGADGVILVIDSSPEMAKENLWAVRNLLENLKANGLDTEKTPIALQWNKRDLPNARPVAEMQREINHPEWPCHEAVATTGSGVVETFSSVLAGAIARAYGKAGQQQISLDAIQKVVDKALEQARTRAPMLETASAAEFQHRFDLSAYRDHQAKSGHNRQVVDQDSLIAEAVNTNMLLAEKLDGLELDHKMNLRRGLMMEALSQAAPALVHPSGGFLPEGVLGLLLKGCQRSQGAVLFFSSGKKVMDEREVVPGGKDPLNAAVVESLGSVAFRLCQEPRFRVVPDLASEVFFGDVPPEATGLASALVAPLRCEGLAFGALLIYSQVAEPAFDETEQKYWLTASILAGLSIHWRLVRKKLRQAPSSAAPSPGTPPPQAR
ncbi:MAG: ATP/GTP-binding protein [Acidobacteriota bacterium]